MTATVLLTLFAVGLAVGLVSGLIGIGGGALIVPFLYFYYAHPRWSGVQVAPGLEAAVAHATSLFVIVPTAIRGTLSYRRAGLVAWRAALPVAAASVVSAVVGARLALVLPEQALKLGFGVLLTLSAVQLLRGGAAAEARARGGRALWKSLATGFAVGLFSALLGIGGGIIAIPLLMYLVGIELRKVAATSLAIVMFSATAGTLTYALSGPESSALVPEGTLGYVHVAAGLPILAGSILSVRWGAALNQRLPARQLRALFAVVFLLMGLHLIAANAAHVF